MNKEKGISVIIPTYNRADLLKKTLDSLSLQNFDISLFEVIIIDDGSTDSTKSVVDSFAFKINTVYLYQEHIGFRVAKARNMGIQAARFSICLFFDSGMIASPDLLALHFDAHTEINSSVALVGYAFGFDEFSETQLAENLEFYCQQELHNIFIQISALDSCRDSRYLGLKKLGLSFDEISIPWLLFWTCHASCSTEELLRINGFDEYFNSWGGEDVELAIRLYKNDVKIFLLDDAKAIHFPHKREISENKRSSYLNCQYIYAKHPSWETALLAQKNQPWEHIIERVHVAEKNPETLFLNEVQ